MRNLKRVLSLALALVMMLGMMIVGASAASADFPDAAEIDYTEAVDVISGLGIMTGDEKGNFNPDLILTREQAAKIICYVLMGAENAEKLGNNTQIFTDVAAGRWSAGYIAYCANLGILVGDGNGLFRPEDNLTGVQFGKMLLVAAGYNADTQGYANNADWATNIATDMIDNGLDIKGVILANDLTREQAAQMVLQAMDMGTVTYTTGNVVGMIGPFPTEETFAEKYFPNLEKLEGVVITANEYANLYDDEPLAAGRTTMDGVVYNYSSEITDIGMSFNGWANGRDVLYLADSGKNNVFETGAATDIGTAAKFQRATGLTGADAESFLNFADAYNDVYEADIRIVYSTDGTADTMVSIAAGRDLTEAQYTAIRNIFYDETDYEDGWVIVGTTYTDVDDAMEKDVSNTMSFRTFRSEYLLAGSEDAVTVDGSENGEWLKVIDNDGDGKADYVLKTEFAMSRITDITNRGVYTFTALENDDQPSIEALRVNESDIVTSDELAEGDVVIYTIIDGVYYVDIAEMVTETIDRHGIDSKTETITCDGTVYGQSHIGYADLMDSDITEAVTQEAYDLYLDHFGYVRLYIESAYNRGFVLLTDGYYYTNNRTEEFQATIYDHDADELVDVDVAAGRGTTAASVFIDTDEDGDNGNRGTWKRLIEAGQVYFEDTAANDPFLTNIAAFSASNDVYTLTAVENASNRTAYEAQELNVTTRTHLTDRTLYNVDGGDIQTTTATVYYLVVKNGTRITDVLTWTGYANAPKDAELAEGAVGYTVTVDGDRGTDYDVAQIVVFETAAVDADSLYFVYRDKAVNDTEVYAIGYDADEETYGDTHADVNRRSVLNAINFYNISDAGVPTLVGTADNTYADNNIYAGETYTAADVDSRDYVRLAADENTSGQNIYFRTADVPAFVVSQDTRGRYNVSEQVENFEVDDKLIVVTDSKLNVLYVINVTQSVVSSRDNTILTAVQNLYDAICDEAEPEEPVTDPDDYLRLAVADEINGVWNGEGDGTAEAPFELIAEGCLNGVNETTLKVTAITTDQEIKIAYNVAGVASATGVDGFAEDEYQSGGTSVAPSDGNTWAFSIDGVYFTITVEELSHDTAPTAINSAVTVSGTTITVKTTYGDGSTLTRASLEAALTLAAGSELTSYTYDQTTGNGAAVITAECGHTVSYTVEFDNTNP